MPVIPRDPRPLAAIPTPDLIILGYIVKLGISALRCGVPGVSDLDALRAELAAREAVAA